MAISDNCRDIFFGIVVNKKGDLYTPRDCLPQRDPFAHFSTKWAGDINRPLLC